jgi:hypothetical protein
MIAKSAAELTCEREAYVVRLDDGATIPARTVIIATGADTVSRRSRISLSSKASPSASTTAGGGRRVDGAMDMAWAELVGQIAKAYRK